MSNTKTNRFVTDANTDTNNQGGTKKQVITSHAIGHRIPPHPLSKLVPARSQKEKDRLFEDIEKNGLQTPGLIHEGELLDGNERNEACIKAGIPFQTIEYTGDSPINFILASHCQNRSLTAAQKAIFAARMVNLELGSNQYSAKGSAELQTQGFSVQDAAKAVGVSKRSIAKARTVIKHSPKLAVAVCENKISLDLAEMTAKQQLPLNEIEQILEQENSKQALHDLLECSDPLDESVESYLKTTKISSLEKTVQRIEQMFDLLAKQISKETCSPLHLRQLAHF